MATIFRWRKSSFSGNDSDCVEVGWRKSSFSAGDSNCVEVGWRKSSFSGGDGNCVELAWPGVEVAVRDSKNPEAGHITLAVSAFEQFRTFLR